jgi:aminoglycoside phosphotransferase (APT) family kinase protein
VSDTPGLDPDVVTPWLEANLTGFAPPYNFSLIAAGGSNLTYRVSADNKGLFILRRPPVRARVASAHDMHREYRIMNALQGSVVPVPEMLAYCEDSTLLDSEFYCMELVPGHALQDRATTQGMNEADCQRATESLLDAQVALHTLDLKRSGLADLAQHDGYVLRQLKRWQGQIDSANRVSSKLFAALHQQLVDSAPVEICPPGLAHGDYRFDNCILADDFTVAAVLDWELCTIGDPLADFVWSLNYWANPGEELTWLLDPPTVNSNFPRRERVFAMYRERIGVDLQHFQWYDAFSWWKQACIVEGVYNRLLQGAGGGMKVASPDAIKARILSYLKRCRELLQALN